MAQYKETSMGAIFQNRAAKYGEKAMVAYKKDGAYVDLSWNQMNDMVHKLAWYLLSSGIKKGDKVALFSENRWEWWLTDLAILSIGAVNVPVYATNSADEAEYILDNSESKACICGSNDHLDRVLSVKKKLKKLKDIIIIDAPKGKKPGVITIQEAMKKGEAYKGKANFEKALKAIKLSDLATLIYTSGTTGNPKGVMLTQNNFVSNVNQIMNGIEEYLTENDTFLSFLPLSHSLERTAGYYLAMFVGVKVAFAESFQTIQSDFVMVKPTGLISVPRLYEKIHSGIVAKVADAPPVKKALFNWAMGVAKQNLPYVCKNIAPTGLIGFKVNLAEKLIFSKLKAALGMDQLRLAVSGGGPLSVSDAEFFLGMGLRILEGFGLTETTPVTNYNRPWLIKPGTVGPAVKDTEIKISDEGEILIKGPQVMKGYYKNPADTKEAFTKDGFFRTGDIGMIDEDGYLSITGRIKDIIITAGGKNISPQNIENSLKTSHYIEQVAVIGDRRKYLAALIVPAFEELKKWAKKSGIAFSSNQDLIENAQVNAMVGEEVKKYTKQFARVEQIRKFRLLDAEWTQATGELTPSLKVKRKIVNTKYAAEIESLYPEGDGD
ncbi:MAG: long-chain fatty acid--CoA ligase [Spirochaetes bacterium]|nr:MAG: long-chain fatty acid--CoA ligase [Spirochaetota bacterium]